LKATDFDLSQQLVFNPDKGLTSFKDSRIVLFDANAIGLLRQNLIDDLGMEKAREFFLKFSFQHGYSDFMQMKINYEFDTEMDLLASGPVIHTWEGLVKAVPSEIRYDRMTGHGQLVQLLRSRAAPQLQRARARAGLLVARRIRLGLVLRVLRQEADRHGARLQG
jgi:hypothetical protein